MRDRSPLGGVLRGRGWRVGPRHEDRAAGAIPGPVEKGCGAGQRLTDGSSMRPMKRTVPVERSWMK